MSDLTFDSFEDSQVISCSHRDTKDWVGWNNLMPPPPNHVHVRGSVEVPNPGVTATLVSRGMTMPGATVLELDLVLTQKPGMWPSVMTWVPAEYTEELNGQSFMLGAVFCNDKKIAEFMISNAH